jgi:hypothetical protein
VESSSEQAQTGQPSAQPAVPDRRGGEERRAGGERRSSGRRAEDLAQERRDTTIAVAWAVTGAIVVLYLFFMAVGAVDPGNARAATIVVLVLAIVWVAHAWRRLYAGGYVSRPDRERRGF